MSQKQLVAAIYQRFRSLNRRERITKIRELASASPEDDRFMRRTFPELYHEAFQPTRREAVGARQQSGSVREPERFARSKSQQFSPFHD